MPLAFVLLVLLQVTGCCVSASGAAAGIHHAESKGSLPFRHLHSLLHRADQKLFGNDSSMLDVPGAVQLLSEVHSQLAQHLGTTAMQRSEPSSSSTPEHHNFQSQLMQLSLQQHGSQPPPAPAVQKQRPTANPARLQSKRAKAASQLQDLGRASYMLAALSASGLISEYLPRNQLDAQAARAVLCEQLHTAASKQAAVSRDGRSHMAVAQQHHTGCKLASTDSAVLQELEWLVTAAAAGTVEAQMALADRFLMGRGGLTASCEHALAWLQSAASGVLRMAHTSGNWDMTPSFIRLRERFMDMTSPQSYSEWDEEQMGEELQAAAAFGSADTYAQRRLGYRLLLGRGVPMDYRAAYENFVAAADGGNDGYALYNLGMMYLKGWYVAKDPGQALQYFGRALERGVGAAANAIGVLTAYGQAMPADHHAAARWFERGANMSDPDSIYNLGMMYLHGRGAPKDGQTALMYYGMAFDLGHWKAAYALGQLYAAGVGHNCEYAEKYLWQFVSQRSGWLSAAQAALLDYDSPSSTPTTQPDRTEDTLAATQANTGLLNTGSTQGELAGSNGQSGTGSHADVRDYAPARMPGRYPQALLRYLLLAEAGCEAAAENAAWMLLHAQGASGPRAMGLAAHLLYRSSLLNHTSSMVELARLLLSEDIIIHPQHLQQAVSASDPHQLQQAVTVSDTLRQHSSTGQAAEPSTTSVTLGLLHHVLLQQPNAFMPPVDGPTACTGMHRRQIPAVVNNVSNMLTVPTARSTPTGMDSGVVQQGSSSGHMGSGAGGASGLMLLRARRAAVAWLSEASSVGDAEAAAQLAWLWHEGVLQGNRAKQEALAVISGALAVQSQPGQQRALRLAQAVIWLEQQASRLLGTKPVAALRALLVAARDAAVRMHGTQPPVLDLPDGLCTVGVPDVRVLAARHGLRFSLWVQLQRVLSIVERRVMMVLGGAWDSGREGDAWAAQARGWWVASGADRVDRDNLILTVLMGALAGALWLHRRQRAMRPAGPVEPQHDRQRQGAGAAAGRVAGPTEQLQQQQ